MSAQDFASQLVPPDNKAGERTHWLNLEAAAWFSDPKNFEARKKLLHQFVRRKKRGTRANPVRRTRGVLPEDAIETCDKQRRAHVAASLMRLLSWCTLHCDWRSKKIGAWRDGRIHYPTRCQIADGAGFEAIVDAKGRVRAWELDDRINDAIAAGFLFRLVDKDSEGRPSEFKIRKQVWQVCGLWVKRQLAKAHEQKKQRKAEQAAEAAPAVPAVAALVGELARAANNDSNPYGKPPERERRGWPPRKPPS